MTPALIEEKKRAGLAATRDDVLWLVELCEALAKGLRAIPNDRDFNCAACGRDPEQGHGQRCPMPVAEAVLDGRWKLL